MKIHWLLCLMMAFVIISAVSVSAASFTDAEVKQYIKDRIGDVNDQVLTPLLTDKYGGSDVLNWGDVIRVLMLADDVYTLQRAGDYNGAAKKAVQFGVTKAAQYFFSEGYGVYSTASLAALPIQYSLDCFQQEVEKKAFYTQMRLYFAARDDLKLEESDILAGNEANGEIDYLTTDGKWFLRVGDTAFYNYPKSLTWQQACDLFEALWRLKQYNGLYEGDKERIFRSLVSQERFKGIPRILAIPNDGRAPLRVTFQDATQPKDGVSITAREWHSGSSVWYGTEVRDVVLAQALVNYGISLKVTFSDGTTATNAINYIPKVPQITVDQTAVNPLQVTFSAPDNDLVSGAIWQFGDGIVADGGKTVTHTYADHGKYLVSMIVVATSGEHLPTVTTTIDTTYHGPTLVQDTTLPKTMTWTAQGSPYMIQSTLVIPNGMTLTIAPGVVLKFSPGAGLDVRGNLVGQGTAQQPIYFTSLKDDSVGGDTNGDGSATSPAKGDWPGIVMPHAYWLNSRGSAAMSNCIFRYGGSGQPGTFYCYGVYDGISRKYLSPILNLTACEISNSSSSGVYYTGTNADPQSPTFTNCKVSDCSGDGMYFNQALGLSVSGSSISNVTGNGISTANYSGLANLTNTIITGCGNQAVLLSGTNIGTSFDGVSTSGNEVSGIALQGCTIYGSQQWGNTCQYILTGNLQVPKGSSLSIAPGAIFKSAGGTFDIEGTVTAPGTSAAPIYFTSLKDDSIGGDTNGDGSASTPAKGDWGGVRMPCYYSGAIRGSATLSNCIFRYGGSGQPGTFYCTGVYDGISRTYLSPILNLTSCEISHSSSSGVYYTGTNADPQSPTFANCTISDCGGDGMYFNQALGLSVSGSSISNVTGNGISTANYSTINDISSTTVTGCGGSAMLLVGSTIATNFDGVTISGNKTNAIVFQGSSVSGDHRWDSSSQYALTGTLAVPKGSSLCIAPGAIFKSLGGILDVQGVLSASGTAQQPIYFTSLKDDSIGGDTNGDGSATSPAKGDWSGVKMPCYYSGAIRGSATLSNCIFRYGGSGQPGTFYCTGVYDGISRTYLSPILNLTSCEISHSSSSGVYYTGTNADPQSPTFANCTISDCGGDGMYFNQALGLSVSGSSISNVTGNGISTANYSTINDISSTTVTGCGGSAMLLVGSTIATNFDGVSTSGNKTNGVVFQASSLSGTRQWGNTCQYILTGNLQVPKGSSLSIAPGAIFKSAGGTFDIEGTVTAPGTSAAPIYFTSLKDDSIGGDTNGDSGTSSPAKGDWSGVYMPCYYSGAIRGSATLSNCIFRYCGNAFNCFGVDDGISRTWLSPILNLTACEISHCSSTGVSYRGSTSDNERPTLTQCVISDCNGDGLSFSQALGVSVSRCLIRDISGTGLSASNYSSISILNCTYTNCSLGALNINKCGSASVNNTIMAGCGQGITSVNTSTAVTFCDAWNNSGGNYSGCVPGTGCVSSEPLFVSSSDCHLQLGSPCIDTGDPSIFDSDGTRSDMGAYRFADHAPPSPGDAKTKDTGQPVGLKTMYVTAAFNGFFYVEDHNRSNGIRIEKAGYSITSGKIIDLSGTSGETGNGERCVLADTITQIGSGTIGPLGIANKALASGAFGYQQSSWQWQWIEDPTDSITDYRQRKVVDGKIMKECWRPCAGLNTTGLLVRTWGKVADPDSANHVFYIDDGSALTNYDGTRHGMKVAWNGAMPGSGANVIVTGVTSCEWDLTCPGDRKTLLPLILATSVGMP